jgi:hypothetical protein
MTPLNNLDSPERWKLCWIRLLEQRQCTGALSKCSCDTIAFYPGLVLFARRRRSSLDDSRPIYRPFVQLRHFFKRQGNKCAGNQPRQAVNADKHLIFPPDCIFFFHIPTMTTLWSQFVAMLTTLLSVMLSASSL